MAPEGEAKFFWAGAPEARFKEVNRIASFGPHIMGIYYVTS